MDGNDNIYIIRHFFEKTLAFFYFFALTHKILTYLSNKSSKSRVDEDYLKTIFNKGRMNK